MRSVDQYVLFIILSSVAGLCSIAAACASVFFRGNVIFPSLRGCLFAQTGWLVCNVIELLDPTEAGTVFWSQMGYPFLTFGIVLWFAFALEYAGLSKWLVPGRLALFFIAPLVTTLLAFTNDAHHLIWVSVSFVPVLPFRSVVGVVQRHGLWFWFWFVYAYAIFACGVFLVVREFLRPRRRYASQSPWILAGAFIPIAVNSIYLFKLVPGWTKDYSPLAFVIGGICATLGTVNYRLLRADDIARRDLVERMRDGIIVIDRKGNVVDINPVAQERLGLPSDFVLGGPVADVFPSWSELGAPIDGAGERSVGARTASREEPVPLRIVGMADEKGGHLGYYIVVGTASRGREGAAPDPQRAAAARLKYEKAALDPSVMTARHAALVMRMESERLYLDPDLDLPSLAEHTGINRNDISQILNVHAGTSFNDFVNGFRIREVIRVFADPGSADRSILDIAFSSGFNSKATFNLVFKKMKRMSPSELRKSLKQASPVRK